MFFDRSMKSVKTMIGANNNSLVDNNADAAMNESTAILRTTSGQPANVIEHRHLRKNRERPRISSTVTGQNEENFLNPLSIILHRENRRRERRLLQARHGDGYFVQFLAFSLYSDVDSGRCSFVVVHN